MDFLGRLSTPPKTNPQPAIFEPFSAAGIFHDAIQRHVLGNNDFSHAVLLLSSIQCCLQFASARCPSGPPDDSDRATIALMRVYLRADQYTSLEQGVMATYLQKATGE